MTVAFIVRSTLFAVRGGDTVQVLETAASLREAGVDVDIITASQKINYARYDGLHFFNITRPSDMLAHIQRSNKPFVVSTILIDYSVYDKHHRGGLAGKLLSLFTAQRVEYIKTLARFFKGDDKIVSSSYWWKGQRESVREILQKTAAVLVQAEEEYDDLVNTFDVAPAYFVVKNGINTKLFTKNINIVRQPKLVLCVARIEGIKNQLNLIRALNNTDYNLVLIGSPAPNQQAYYHCCRNMAEANISFVDHLPQQELAAYYSAAAVHILPSWFEVCGLSSLEAAAMGCRVVITGNGYARTYFKDAAFYCDPSKPDTILQAIEKAAAAGSDANLQQAITENYSWKKTAADTLAVYKKLFH